MLNKIRKILRHGEPENIDVDAEIERLSAPTRAALLYLKGAVPHLRPYLEELHSETYVFSLDRDVSLYGEGVALFLRESGKEGSRYLGIIKISRKRDQEEIRRHSDKSLIFVQSNYSDDTVTILEELAKTEKEQKGKIPWVYLSGTLEIQSYPILNSESPYEIPAKR